jgi:hypothetical protein
VSQKCNLNKIFHEGKGHIATEKRALFRFSENLGGGGGGLGPLPRPVPTPQMLNQAIYVRLLILFCAFTDGATNKIVQINVEVCDP